MTVGTPPVLAAKRATNTIPIIAANADNLVELGVVASLARPGGNVTGSTRVDADFSAKRLELLKETLPKLSRVAVLSHGALGADQEELKEIQAAARPLGIQIHSFTTQEPGDFLPADAEVSNHGADALIVFTSAFTLFDRSHLKSWSRTGPPPMMCGGVRVGTTSGWGYLGWCVNGIDMFWCTVVWCKIFLKEQSQPILPVEQPTNPSS